MAATVLPVPFLTARSAPTPPVSSACPPSPSALTAPPVSPVPPPSLTASSAPTPPSASSAFKATTPIRVAVWPVLRAAFSVVLVLSVANVWTVTTSTRQIYARNAGGL